jgi:NAD(P)-dependent dehydrogenase (short-subunit alcohol dehydrogenase family)
MQLAAIFGAGGRVGHSVALRFLNGGYQVAVISRSGSKSLDEEVVKHKGNLRQYQADLSKADDAIRVWKQIEEDFDTPVSVVHYNGECVFFHGKSIATHMAIYAFTAATNSSAATPLEISLEDFRKSLEINTISVFALAQQAIGEKITCHRRITCTDASLLSIESFKKLPSSTPKAFIFTGNGLDDPNAFPAIPAGFFTLAQGKGATATLIDVASQAYGPSGQK